MLQYDENNYINNCVLYSVSTVIIIAIIVIIIWIIITQYNKPLQNYKINKPIVIQKVSQQKEIVPQNDLLATEIEIGKYLENIHVPPLNLNTR